LRILVYGVTGSGKSTLARRIGDHLRLPYHAVDDLTWKPNWVPVPGDIQRERLTAICAGDQWVLDSAYGMWLDVPLARATLVVGLDYPRWLSLSRLIRRSVGQIVRKTPTCNGNVETWRNLFGAESIVGWHFKSFKRKQRRMRQWQTDPDKPAVLLFRSPRAATAWLQAFPPDHPH
jgi:adenylate kinase family enzyme